MTWETIPLRGASVTVSWRVPGGRGCNRQLCITISSGVCEAIGLRRGGRVVVQRDRFAGKLRLLLADDKADGGRRPAWKRTKNADVAVVFVPLKDVTLDKNQPAQLVACEPKPGELVVRLPHWACPIAQVSRPAMPFSGERVA